MRINDSRVAGFYPLQHQNYHRKSFDLQLRGSIFGLRITDRYVGVDDMGEWEIDPDSVGDIHGGQLLKKDSREVPMWRFATPMIVNPGSGTSELEPGASGGGGPSSNIGFVFGGVNLDFTQGGPDVGITLDGQVPNFNQGGPQAGISLTEPLPPGSDADGDPASGAPQATGGGDAQPSNPKCGVAPSSFEVFPIFDANFSPDDRLQPLSLNKPKIDGKDVWPKFPNSWIGLSLVANDERDQVDLFLPTDPRLVAVNFAGDKDMGSRVYDLDDKFNVDDQRGQALQSMMRVIKKPLGEPNVLAWQLGPSGCEDTHGGYVIDDPTGGGGGSGDGSGGGDVATGGGGGDVATGGGSPAAGTDVPLDQIGVGGAPGSGGGAGPGSTEAGRQVGTGKVIARMSRNNGGPIDVGSGECQHVLGRDADGTPIVRGHIAHNFLLREDDTKDGPLMITDWKPGDEGNKEMKVKFGWNALAKKWDWWTTTYMDFPSEVVPVPPIVPTTPTTLTPITTPSLTPVTTPSLTPVTTPSLTPVATPGPPGGPSIGGTMGASSVAPSASNLTHLMTDQALGVGEIEAKPYNFADDMEDLRFKKKPSDKGSSKRLEENPVTGTLATFGAQGGSRSEATVPAPPSPPSPPPPTPAGPPPAPPSPPSPPAVTTSPLQEGATGDPWGYTHKPGRARFRGGTANGGFVFLPPEVGMERISKGLVPPDNVTRSEAFFGVGPGASFFAGIPEIVSGRPKDGWSWGMDEDTGDLVFRAHHAGDAGIDAVKLDLDAETIQFKARTTHYGTLRHFSSAARTWDFPDITGRVLVTDGTVQTGGGAAATLGTIGGSGPGTAAQAIWASIDIGGTQFFIPLWI